MDLVVDANVLFASLIKQQLISELILNEDFHLYAPEYLLEEFSKYENLIIGKTKRSKKEFDEIFNIIEQLITIVPAEEFEQFTVKASEICPDAGDIPYIALALKLKCAVWSNDRPLKERQSVVKVFPTEELMKL